MNAITLSNLEAVVDRINRITESPATPYSYNADGRGTHANVGNYHLDGAYGGYALHQMDNESGGVRDVLQCGHTTKRDLYDRMHAFLRGYEACNRNRELAETRA